MAESKVKRENYVNICGWMLTDLKLKGNELIVYAIIYGFSQAENQVFSGSLKYLADWTNSTKQSVTKCLKSLVEKGYIKKSDKIINGVKFCEYYATEFNTVYNKVVQGMQQSCIGGVQQSLTNNIGFDNASNNTSNNKPASRFVPPAVEEVRAYCLERKNNVDAERFVDYYESKGWIVGKTKMKDWKASVRTWERNNFGSNNNKQNVGANGIAIQEKPNSEKSETDLAFERMLGG